MKVQKPVSGQVLLFVADAFFFNALRQTKALFVRMALRWQMWKFYL